jgi:sugar lactone lactonase YvrE
MRLQKNGTRPELFVDTKGRPLGLKFDQAGNLIVADAVKGLLSVDQGGIISVLATAADGIALGITNDLDIAANGTIYFTDASSRYPLTNYKADILEHQTTGRLLAYEPSSKTTRLVRGELSFANGVALSPDQSFVLVNETGKYRIHRVWLSGANSGKSEIFIENLPGFPDNLSRDPKTGHFWVALYTVRNPRLDSLHPRPFLKNQLAKLPRLFWPKPEPYGLVLEVDPEGRIVRSLHDPGGRRVRGITSAERAGGKLYLGSLEGGIAVVELGTPPP